MFLASAAHAQSWRSVDTRDLREGRPPAEWPELQLDGFDVEQIRRLEPGAALVFTVFGTPIAAASVQIEGAARWLELREVQPGVYEGTYLIGADDRIAPDSRVTATLRRGERVARSVLEEPLQLAGAAQRAQPAAASERAVAARPAAIDEDKPAPVFGGARARGLPASAVAAVALAGTTPAATPPAPSEPGAATACSDCAIVESIRAVELDGEPGPVGTISGALIGAVFGDQAAREHDRRVGRILGAIGGAFIGREIERRGTRRVRYDIVLRLPGGATQTRSYLDSPPPWRVGDTVRVEATLARAERWQLQAPSHGHPHGTRWPAHGGTP